MVAVASSSRRNSAGRRKGGPRLNIFDVPEIMPGAKCSATPAQREEFEDRCRKLYIQGLDDGGTYTCACRNVSVTHPSIEWAAMFPALDQATVNVIVSNTKSTNDAIEALLAISADATIGDSPTAMPCTVRFDDHEQFPCLSDRSALQMVHDTATSPGSTWRDLAQAATAWPSPPPTRMSTSIAARKFCQRKSVDEDNPDDQLLLTEYEARHDAGEKRMHLRAIYARKSASKKQTLGLDSPVTRRAQRYGDFFDYCE